MSVLNQLRMYLRFASGLREFLKEPMTIQQSREIIKHRLENRERNLLTIVKRAIYENENSPYLKLLSLAGCEYGDFERLVQTEGIEPTLRKLCQEGVYISIEEFKGKKEARRGGKTFEFKENDFDNPFLLQHLQTSSSGSRWVGTRTVYDFEYLALGRAIYTVFLLDAYDALDIPIVLWLPIMPGAGPHQVLQHTKAGNLPAKWFSPVTMSGFKPSLKNRIGTNYIVYVARFWGTKLPLPEYVKTDEAWRVAQWIADAINEQGGCYVHTNPSKAVATCQAAKERGVDVASAKFCIGAEPITKMKRQEIESTGASVCPRYVFTEGGYVGLGCFHPSAPDDVHFFKDSLALVQHKRKVHGAGLEVDAFLFTSLLLSAPKILLNVEIGDYGIIESRSCGCKFEELGLTDHIHGIRSFDKLTSHGMTFWGIDLIRIIEEVLPAKFGGTSIDYQMFEEEDEKGHTHMSIIVRPEVGEIDETGLIKTILTEISKGDDTYRMMADVWSQAKILRVKRMRPLDTVGGKLLPLHFLKDD
ncbi:hypothetical protein ACFLV3_01250 [Chloroflexota bacterium]